jgi:hypothetical protein
MQALVRAANFAGTARVAFRAPLPFPRVPVALPLFVRAQSGGQPFRDGGHGGTQPKRLSVAEHALKNDAVPRSAMKKRQPVPILHFALKRKYYIEKTPMQKRYRPWKLIDWEVLKLEALARDLARRCRKAKRAVRLRPWSSRFRLTRFGWERRQAGHGSGYKMWKSHKKKARLAKIQYVHRTELRTMNSYTSERKLVVRDQPVSKNPNLKPVREYLPGGGFG